MSKKILRIVVVALIATAGLQGQGLLAATVAVGPPTCQSGKVHFSTIQSAVNAVPTGSTILVCPGTYPEQVTISEPLTLNGVTDGTGNAAVITVPSGGLVVNATSNSFGPVATQLLVANTVEVTIQNITIDGTGSGCPSGANRVVGLEFYQIGVPVDGAGAGRIQNVAVRHEQGGCGEGIVSDTSFITITNNEVHDIDFSPILAFAGQTSITNNNVQNALNGIVLDGGTTTTTVVSNNTISNLTPNFGFTQVSLWVNGGSAIVKGNTIANAPGTFGIYLPFTSPGTTVTGNKVNAVGSGFGVFLTGSSGTSVQSNTISNTSSDAIVDVSSGGGNVITKNTINEAAFGIFESSTGTDTLTPNFFFNVVVTIDPNPFNNPGTTSP